MRRLRVALVLLFLFLCVSQTKVDAAVERENCKVGKTYSDTLRNYADYSYYTYKFKYKTKIKVTISGRITDYEDDTPKLAFDMDNNQCDSRLKFYIKDKKLSLNSSSYTKTLTVDAGEIYLSFEFPYDSAVCKYKVKVEKVKEYPPAATKISMRTSKTIYTGDSYTIKPKVLAPKDAVLTKNTWTSSNKKIATVNKNGKVTGKRNGTCTITCRLQNGKKYRCRVKVKTKPVITIPEAGFYIDSAGGVCPYVTISNNTNKKIKYIYLETYFYNTVGDPAYCFILGTNHRRLQIVGPQKKKTVLTYYWNPVIYNYNTGKMKIKTATVIFTDRTKKKLTINQSFK